MTNPNQPHPDPLGPVKWLVKRVLHKDRNLADNVRRLRWKRTRPPAPVEQPAPEVQP